MGILEELLADLKPKKARVVRLDTKRASGTALYEGAGAEGELDSVVAKMLEEASWRTLARTIRATHQTCECCGKTTSHVDGIFIRQQRREATRFVAKLYFTKLDLDNLPLEIMEFNSRVQHCFECASFEVRLDSLMRVSGGDFQCRQVQLSLSFKED